MSVLGAAVARQAVLQAGFSAEDLRPLRVHSNAVFLLPRQRIVVRVGGGADAAGRAGRAVAATQWLVGLGFPAVEPFNGVTQPILLSDEEEQIVAATFWHQVGVQDRWVAAGDLGELLRWLHRLPAPPFGVPFFRPLDRLVAVASTSTWLTQSDREWLLGRASSLQVELDDVTAGVAGSGLVHGDAQLSNVLAVEGRRGVLADWDGVAMAPLMWDLVPTAMEPRFGGGAELLEELLVAYGADPRDLPGWRTLCEVFELRSVAAHIRRAPDSPAHAVEAGVRIASLRAGDRSVRWSAVG